MASLAATVEELYRVFAAYPRPERVSPCTFCWTEEEITVFRTTPLREIGAELVRQLLWETADHWESVEAYKHYLPRILEGTTTPELGVEDLYPEHLAETLAALGFAGWPTVEREAVRRFLGARDHDEVLAYTLTRGDASFLHQHVVDAFAAQHADETTKPIAVTFALVGLYLHVEKHRTGREVQRVHMKLAEKGRTWPSWSLPTERGAITAADVLAAPAGPERDRVIDAWSTSVWQAFHAHRAAIVALLEEYGID